MSWIARAALITTMLCWQASDAVAQAQATQGEPAESAAEDAVSEEGEGGEPSETAAGALILPGEVDALFRAAPDFNSYNAFVWMPVFRGGLGYVDAERGSDLAYAGGYARPLLAVPQFGDLIIGGLVVDDGSSSASEFQGSYRTPIGIGFAGGFAHQQGPLPDVTFGKLSFQEEWKGLSYLFELLYTDFDAEQYVGGYGAVWGDLGMLVAGYDGEQYRLTGAFLAPESGSPIRPALEAIWADASVGSIAGPRVVFVNASLGFSGGFLSNPARLGRAMGPTGIQYGNPNGFLDPTWNRRFDVWEIGRLSNLRYEWVDPPSGEIFQRLELVVFPFAFVTPESPLAGLFAGPTYLDDAADGGAGILFGFSGRLDRFIPSLGIDYQFSTGDVRATAGLRIFF